MSVNFLFVVVVVTQSVIDLSQPQARVNFPLNPLCGVTFAGPSRDDPNRDTGPGNDRFASAYAPAFDDIRMLYLSNDRWHGSTASSLFSFGVFAIVPVSLPKAYRGKQKKAFNFSI
jgi:hypothetical protein